MTPHHLILLLVALSLAGCRYFRNDSDQLDLSGYNLEQVKKDLKPLNLAGQAPPTEAIAAYFDFYDLSPTNALHFFGTTESEERTLAIHVFMPEEPRGTLFLLHGYFDHAGTLSKLIAEGLSRRYAIVIWDLPGHGLSSGGRTETGHFDLCSNQFADAVKRAGPVLPEPFHLVAHSTGCSIAIEYMYSTPINPFEHIVFLAPLVRHTHWGWGKFGYSIGKPFTKRVRRRAINNSSDEDYRAFVKKDPLHSSDLSLQYLGDLYRWEKRFKTYPVWPGSIRIVQGDADTVVDWEYNLEFLRTRIQHTEVHMIRGAKHQLVNERKELREQAFDTIFSTLEQAANHPKELSQD
jgi:alpha-beta hydrolase superfamily lysophospholipase